MKGKLKMEIPVYEQAVPYEAYEYGMKDVIRSQADGYVRVRGGPGLGVRVDWEAIQAATIHVIRGGETRDRRMRPKGS